MRKALVLLSIFIVIASCRRGKKTVHVPPPEELFKKAEKLYNDKKYYKAAEVFNKIILNYPGCSLVPEAQYYLAYSYYYMKDYERAEVEFEFLYRQFPTSAYAEEGELMAAVCMYLASPPYYKDQTKTLEAKKMFEKFIKRHPNSPLKEKAEEYIKKINEKLAQKEFETALLYYKFAEYRAALQSFKYIVENFPDTDKAKEAKRYMEKCKKYLEK